MIEIEDIQDSGSLKEWLDQVIEEKGEEDGWSIAVFIGHRAAMRVLPLTWRWTQTSRMRAKKI
jgi:hypothetical protein